MVFIHKGWKLHTRDVILKGGKKQTIYFFSKKNPKSGTTCDMPNGYKLKESKSKGSGMPYITKR